MEQRTLVKWLKILVLFAAVCGLGLAGGVLPLAGQWLVESYPEFSYCFWPWLIFLWVLSAPCFKAYLDAILTCGERVDGSSLFPFIE